jgi:hypothetical protein
MHDDMNGVGDWASLRKNDRNIYHGYARSVLEAVAKL